MYVCGALVFCYQHVHILNSQASMHPSHSVSWKMTAGTYKHQSCLFVRKKGKVHPEETMKAQNGNSGITLRLL